MSYVKFYKLQNNGSQKVVATCRLDKNGQVACEGDEVLIKNLKEGGIKDYASVDSRKLYFNDGMKFLEQLKFNFTSGYLNASEVINE